MKNMNLCQLRKNVHGVSVVIGALMLTLIVVTAAVSFAIFTAQKQEELQKAEYAELLRDSELLRIGGIDNIEFDSSYDYVQNITFSLSSAHTRSSTISTIKFSSGFDQGYIMNFSLFRENKNVLEKWHLKSTGYEMYDTDSLEGITNDSLNIDPNEFVRITINNVTSKNLSYINIGRNDPIIIDVYTILTNDFSKTFIPPTANIEIIDEKNSLILDGSNSICDNDGSVILWKWILNNSDTKISLPDMFGKMINANRILTDDTTVDDTSTSIVTWNITLMIFDNSGMVGFKNITYDQDFRDVMTEDESLSIESINPHYDDFNLIDFLNITVQSNHKYNSSIVELKINNIKNLTINESESNDWDIERYSYDETKMIDLSNTISINKPIQIKIKTDLGNIFEQTFYPPNAIINIDYQDYLNSEILDGSQSDHSGDGYIVEWNWIIETEPFVFNDADGNFSYNSSLGDFMIDDDPDGDGIPASPFNNDTEYGGIYTVDSYGEPFVFNDTDGTFSYNSSLGDFMIDDDPDGDGILASPFNNDTEYGGIYTVDSYGEPFVFNDTDGTFSYNSSLGDFMIDDDPDGDGILASPFNNDTEYGGLYVHSYHKSLFGRKIKAEFSPFTWINDHTITLIVIDNYGMKSIASMNYRH